MVIWLFGMVRSPGHSKQGRGVLLREGAVGDLVGWEGVYDKRFLRPAKPGLRARLNGVLLSFNWLG